MAFSYVILGIENKHAKKLQNGLQQLGNYRNVGMHENNERVLDILLAGVPDVIFINVDDFIEKDFLDLTNTVNDLYRSFKHLPVLIALAQSEKQAYHCMVHNFFYYLISPFKKIKNLDLKLRNGEVQNNISKLCLKTYSDYRFINIDEIIYFKADNNSTHLHLIGEKSIHAYHSLKHFERLMPDHFMRVHQSYIININFISRIYFGKSACYLNNDHEVIPFSKPYKSKMFKLTTELLAISLPKHTVITDS